MGKFVWWQQRVAGAGTLLTNSCCYSTHTWCCVCVSTNSSSTGGSGHQKPFVTKKTMGKNNRRLADVDGASARSRTRHPLFICLFVCLLPLSPKSQLKMYKKKFTTREMDGCCVCHIIHNFSLLFCHLANILIIPAGEEMREAAIMMNGWMAANNKKNAKVAQTHTFNWMAGWEGSDAFLKR